MVPKPELLTYVKLLGREFVRLGMDAHAKRLRLYYLALKHGLTTRGNDVDFRWSEEFVVEWMKTLKLPPYSSEYPTRPRSSPCAKCKDRSSQPAITTVSVLPYGAKMRCGTCGAVWLEPG